MDLTPTMSLYMLSDDNTVVRASSVEEWGEWMRDFDRRRVAETELHNGEWVSTMFLGVEIQWGVGAPLLFETMVFPRKAVPGEPIAGPDSPYRDLECERYHTWAEAEKGHWFMVRKRTLHLCEPVEETG